MPKKSKKFPRHGAFVLKQAERILICLVRYRAVLQKMNPTFFIDAFFDEVSELTVKLRNLPSDIAMRGAQAERTAALKPLFSRFEDLFVSLNAYVTAAFRHDPVILKEFGINRKNEIKNNLSKLLTFIADFTTLWEGHRPALLAVGCPAAFIDEFTALKNECIEKSGIQGNAKKLRKAMTDERRVTANILWEKLQDLENYAESIFGVGTKEANELQLDYGYRKSSGADSVPPPVPKIPTPGSSSDKAV